MDITPPQTASQVQSITSTNGMLHIELPGGLMLTGPCVIAAPPALHARLRADAVPDHFWITGGDEAMQGAA